jgi:hypothetical protein
MKGVVKAGKECSSQAIPTYAMGCFDLPIQRYVRPDNQYHLQISVESIRQGEEEYALGQLGQNEAPKRKRWRAVDQGHSLTLRCYLNNRGIWLRIPTLCVCLILKAKYFHSTDVHTLGEAS